MHDFRFPFLLENADKLSFVKVGPNPLRLDKSPEKPVMWYREENALIVTSMSAYFPYS